MSKLVPTLLLTAMVYALGAGFASLPRHPATAPRIEVNQATSAQEEIPILPTVVVHPDATSDLLSTTLLPTVTVYPSATEIAEAKLLDSRAVGTGAVIVALHVLGGGLAPGSGLDMPYYSFGKSAYRLRKE